LLGFIFWRLSSEKLKIQKKVDEQTKSLKDYALKLEIINRDLDDFAYVASHDLKEPLRGLYNYAEILEEDYQGKLDEDGRKKLETLKTLAKRMELFVERLFQYSKLSRVELKSAKVDVSELIANVIDIQNIWLQERNATVEIVDEMPMIVCDPPQIEEVFRNLITNGVKYNDKDQKKITIGCKYRPVKNSEPIPVFWVGDNGIGIDSEHKKHIFKIFKRLHGRDEYGGGSGAGLTIVWKIIERHNGQIWVESEKGKGSVFYFTLTGYINDVRSSESENSNLGG
jgi:light-regulated signal transduction histidine kinase (bacteriophytochrome)